MKTWTVPIGLIVIGLLLLLYKLNLVPLISLNYVFPLLIIFLGVEIILVRLRHPEQHYRLGAGNIIFLIVLIIGSFAGSRSFVSLEPGYLIPVEGHLSIDNAIKHIIIDLPDAKVSITGTNTSTLSYNGQMREHATTREEAAKKLKQEWITKRDGNTLKIELKQPHYIHFGWGQASSYLNVQLPANLVTLIDTSNGAIECNGTKGPIELRTTNGAVHAININGNVTIHSSNGAINSENIDGLLNVTTSNGAVTAKNIKGMMTIHTSNGRIIADSPVSGNWIMQASNGAIEMVIPSKSNTQVQATTSNGSLKGNVSWNKNGKNNGSLIVGKGTYLIQARTSNGPIQLNTK